MSRVSLVSGTTVVALRAVRSATASAGSSTVVVTPVGLIASPAVTRSGNVAASRTATRCGPEGRAQS